MGVRLLTPDGGAFAVDVMVSIWSLESAPGGTVRVVPSKVTVPPWVPVACETVLPVPTGCGPEVLEIKLDSEGIGSEQPKRGRATRHAMSDECLRSIWTLSNHRGTDGDATH
jgi:hypothetical protein